MEGDAARKALTIATQTLPILSGGLNPETAHEAASLIRSVTGVTAVALTDRDRILAHVGIGDDHHQSGQTLRTAITRQAIQEDKVQVAEEARAIECKEPHCPLQGVVVTPLRQQKRVVGTLKLYFDPAKSRAPVELAEGLAYHFSTQLALARAQAQAALVDKAEIRALQAQIQPHFLFNALNTVMALIRLNRQQAREVLGHLADFLRRNLHSTQEERITLARELEHVRHYLSIEQARFGEALQISYQIDPGCLEVELPPLTLQPLVENAILHGLNQVKRAWNIQLIASLEEDRVQIRLVDNGQGIPPERLALLLNQPTEPHGTQSGLALHNVHQRLQGLFGEKAGLQITSVLGHGTTVTVNLPKSPRPPGSTP